MVDPAESIADYKRRIAATFPHKVVVMALDRDLVPDRYIIRKAEEWCEAELGTHGERWFNFGGSAHFYFANVTDATLFKLRWC